MRALIVPRISHLVDTLGGWLLPPRCVLCRGAGDRRNFDLCPACAAELPRLASPCARCGLPRPLLEAHAGPQADAALGCAHCRLLVLPYARCFAPYTYQTPLIELVTALKYEGTLTHARVLGTLLAEAVAATDLRAGVDAVVPLPLHPTRLVERGFNQSHEIARCTARALALPCEPYALRRVRITAPQVGLSRADRADNVRDAFGATAGAIAGRHLVVLDDVVTTGSTVAAAAAALQAAGARQVDVWAIARAVA